MHVTITSLRLRKPWHFFALSYHAMKITRQLKESPSTGYKARGFWLTHYTLSSWDSLEDLQGFARSGAHREAMKESAKIAKEIRTYTYETNALPDWNMARKLLRKEGRVFAF